MKVKYGSFEFEPYECSLAMHVTTVFSPRGFQKTKRVQVELEGEVCVSGDEYDVSTRLATIQAAMDVNFEDISLLHTDGSPSRHVLISNHVDNLTGNHVTNLSYPQTLGNEYANGRKFRYLIEAELLSAESNIVEWHDSITFEGNAGEVWRWRRNPQWGFYPERTSPNSLQFVHHQGYAVGMATRIMPPTPFYTGPFEDSTRRVVKFTSGKRHPQAITEPRTDWTYLYQLPTYDDTLRPTLP
jgi:hypothetical protein